MSSISRPWAWLLLVAIFAAAFALRSIGSSNVFLGDATVVLASDDASYHARLVHDGVANFPRLLAFDAFLNHPIGARVPWPPLYDWLLALVGWMLGGGATIVDRMLAWVSPVFGSLAVFPVYFGARALVSRGPALGAAAVYSLLPITVLYARVGNPDHHAWLALLSATYLALSLWQLSEHLLAPSRWAAGLVVLRVLVTLSWSGSLLYLAVGEGALLVAALVGTSRVGPERDSLHRQALGCALAGLLVAPVVALSEAPLGGWFSASALSWIHVLFFVGVAAVVEGLLLLETHRPSSGWAVRLGRASGIAVAVGALLLLLPTVRAGVAPAIAYLSTTSGFFGNPEQLPLYAWMRGGIGRQLPGASAYYGGFAYLFPVPLLAAAWAVRKSQDRSPALVLLVWVLALGALAVAQLRWGNDFAPGASIAFAVAFSLGIEAFTRWFPGRRRALQVGFVGLAGVLLFSAGVRHVQKFRGAFEIASVEEQIELRVPTVQLVRFAQRVRELTGGCGLDLAGTRRSGAGILVTPRYGHVLHYVAHCATPADNFGPQFSLERYEDVLAFLATRDESEAVEIARAHATRYVMTDRPPGNRRVRVAARLHANDGSAREGSRALGQFRLIAEARPGAVGMMGVRGSDAPYKLFEIVEGAQLVAETSPGSLATAQILVRTPGGREFTWRTSSRASTNGRVILRVPYASDSVTGTGGIGPYRVTLDGTHRGVSVREDEVHTGAAVPVR